MQAFTLTTVVLVVVEVLPSHGYEDAAPVEVIGVSGGEATLPCSGANGQFPGLEPGDEPCLVLWFREGSPTPILSADARRGGGLVNAKVWKDDAWDARFSLRPLGLVLDGLRADQQGAYVCRVDFRQAQTLNRLVRLTVLVPPSVPIVRDARGNLLNGSITANDGDSPLLLCHAPGGTMLFLKPPILKMPLEKRFILRALLLSHYAPYSPPAPHPHPSLPPTATGLYAGTQNIFGNGQPALWIRAFSTTFSFLFICISLIETFRHHKSQFSRSRFSFHYF